MVNSVYVNWHYHIMEICIQCSTEQDGTNMHQTKDGEPCCGNCACICVNCERWFFPQDMRDHNNEKYCIECLKIKLDLWEFNPLQFFNVNLTYKHARSVVRKPNYQHMTTCRLCGKFSELLGIWDDGIHDACAKEKRERKQNGLCVKCGENPGFSKSGHSCKPCWDDPNRPYRNYSGP